MRNLHLIASYAISFIFFKTATCFIRFLEKNIYIYLSLYSRLNLQWSRCYGHVSPSSSSSFPSFLVSFSVINCQATIFNISSFKSILQISKFIGNIKIFKTDMFNTYVGTGCPLSDGENIF